MASLSLNLLIDLLTSRYEKSKIAPENSSVCAKKSNYRFQMENTTLFGLQSFRGLGPKIWALIPNELKKNKSLDVFKDGLKKIKLEQCPCNICRVYIDGIYIGTGILLYF